MPLARAMCAITLADVAKLLFPAGWTLFALTAASETMQSTVAWAEHAAPRVSQTRTFSPLHLRTCLCAVVYLTVPETVRVAPAIIALASALPAVLCSIEITLLWRSQYYVLSMAPSEVPNSTKAQLFHRLVASVILSVAFGIALIYFLAIPSLASEPVCGHSSCGADAAWSAIAFVFCLLWLALIRQARGRVVAAGTAAEAFTSADASLSKADDKEARDAEAV